MKSFYSIVIICILSISCNVYDGPEKIIWVFPHKLNGPIHSFAEEGIFFLISDYTELDYSGKSWRRMDGNFEIKGFDFEPGYFYQLQVRGKNKGNGFVLKSILQKQKDYTYRIHGKWMSIPNQLMGSFELNISKITRFASIPSCFMIESSLGEVGEKKIEIFTNSISGLSPCGKPAPWDPKPTGPSGFVILSQAKEYKITSEGFLDFFDAKGNLLIRFKPSE